MVGASEECDHVLYFTILIFDAHLYPMITDVQIGKIKPLVQLETPPAVGPVAAFEGPLIIRLGSKQS